jgi:putative nucleotidyltransferase with HDIG domain
MDTFWRHSMFTALIARGFAKRCRILHPERLFIAGLLHDIGSLVIYNRLPEVARDIILIADGDENALYEAKTRELGFGHPELGALLLELRNIPKPLQNAVRHHHARAKPVPLTRRKQQLFTWLNLWQTGPKSVDFAKNRCLARQNRPSGTFLKSTLKPWVSTKSLGMQQLSLPRPLDS